MGCTSVRRRARRPCCHYSLCVRAQSSGPLSIPFNPSQFRRWLNFYFVYSRSGGQTSRYWPFSLCYSQRRAISLCITSWGRSGRILGASMYIFRNEGGAAVDTCFTFHFGRKSWPDVFRSPIFIRFLEGEQRADSRIPYLSQSQLGCRRGRHAKVQREPNQGNW
jgi:hypothetical protein